MLGVCKPYVAGVIQGAPWLDALVPLDRRGPWGVRWPAVAWQLRGFQLDVAVLFANTFRSALVAALAGCKRRIGVNRHGRGIFLTDRLEPMRGPSGRLTPTRLRFYHAMYQGFILTMLLALVANNLGVLWVELT